MRVTVLSIFFLLFSISLAIYYYFVNRFIKRFKSEGADDAHLRVYQVYTEFKIARKLLNGAVIFALLFVVYTFLPT